MRVITLLSDFGAQDTYVGQMKASILSVCADVQLVDLTHSVPPQDVRGGAFHLWSAVESFPPATVHLAVVDPGVGSARRAAAVRSARGDVLVGPDNGLLTLALERLGGAAQAVELNKPQFWRPSPSSTFHGRDVFGPVAGHLAAGAAVESLGTPFSALVRPFEWPTPRWEGNHLVGEVVHVDVYGNLVTSLPQSEVSTGCEVEIRGRRIPHRPHYAAGRAGEPLAVVGSNGLLEVSVPGGSAASVLGVGRGEPVLRVK
jgi:S-adenosylmethionine hydrolase